MTRPSAPRPCWRTELAPSVELWVRLTVYTRRVLEEREPQNVSAAATGARLGRGPARWGRGHGAAAPTADDEGFTHRQGRWGFRRHHRRRRRDRHCRVAGADAAALAAFSAFGARGDGSSTSSKAKGSTGLGADAPPLAAAVAAALAPVPRALAADDFSARRLRRSAAEKVRMPTAAPADDAHEEDGDAHDVAAAGVSEALARAGDAAGDGAASRAPTVRTGVAVSPPPPPAR